jgi:hypothetical protein
MRRMAVVSCGFMAAEILLVLLLSTVLIALLVRYSVRLSRSVAQPVVDLSRRAEDIIGGVVENGGEYVIVQEEGYHGNLPGRRPGKEAGGIGAAALPPLAQPLLFQEGQGVADGLAAQMVLAAQILLCWQLISGPPAVPGQLLPELVCQKLVFCRHVCASSRQCKNLSYLLIQKWI